MQENTGELRPVENIPQEEKKKWKELPFRVGTGLEIDGFQFRVQEINMERQEVVLKPLGWKNK